MRGYREIYETNPNPVPGYGSGPAGYVPAFLYNVDVAVTLTF